MNRIEQLRPLSMEHHLSLVLANKAIKTAKNGNEIEINALCQQIADEFDSRWKAHFIKEELSIFVLCEEKYRSSLATESPDDANLTDLLREQHNQMWTMSAEMYDGRTDQLAEFGRLLRDHTRLEERRLFPLVSDLFTTQELDLIASTTAHY
ncbi:MAG: hemerythrin domain-containing protein [Cocleimonas sp.]|nr:hemerythrin domain-containing protein [Cocleimonas sp.]